MQIKMKLLNKKPTGNIKEVLSKEKYSTVGPIIP